MLSNYLKIAWRNLIRNKVYSVITISGLALGIAAFLLILEYVSQEQSVNQFHANLPNLVRLLNESPKSDTWGEIEPGWATRIKARFPEVRDFCRFDQNIAKGVVRAGKPGSEPFRETEVGFVDGNFFTFFSFPLRMGQPQSLAKPNVVFVSESTAKKYFGRQNPMGQVLTLSNQFGSSPFTIEGVYADMPANSDISYSMVFSLETLKSPAFIKGNDWATLDNLDNQYINTFFLLNEGVDRAALEKKLIAFRDELGKENDGVKFRLQPFANVHLAASLSDTYQTTGNLKYVYMLAVISFLILLIAWFNYINLATANSLRRANEVGVRKVIGATRQNLVGQFLGELLLTNLLAFGLAIGLISALQPLFNELIGKILSLHTLGYGWTWAVGLAVLVLGTLASGLYTAFRLSGYSPVETLKGKLTKTASGAFLRKSLVVTQFAISTVLVMATLIIYQQLRHMQTKNLGIDTKQLLVIKGPDVGKDSTYSSRKAAFWQAITGQSFVDDYCTSGTVPGNFYNFMTSGFTQPGSKPGDEHNTYAFAIIGDRFLKTYGMTLKAGRNFTAQECAVDWNQNNKVLLNERAIEQLGFDTPEAALRTRMQWDERQLEIIGVVKDYNHMGVQRAIDPIIFYPQINSTYFTLRLTPGRLPEKIATLERLYKDSFVGNPFEYSFIDDKFDKLYGSEQQYGLLFTTASIWAIFIACLGLFGLATATVEQRTKEIGVRKVLGASVGSIVTLLSKDFLKLVLMAIVIASPIAYYAMHRWLQDFAYKIDIEWWVFALAGLLAVGIALLTVGFQSVKAALMNPVKSLRSE